MKLKTLKDLTFENSLEEQYPVERINMFNLDCVKTELRQEAKKWIKEISSIQDKLIVEKKIPLPYDNAYNAQIKWIKHFFNLEAESKDEM